MGQVEGIEDQKSEVKDFEACRTLQFNPGVWRRLILV